jgi:hypothetical protein
MGLVAFFAGGRLLARVPVNPHNGTANLTVNVRRAERFAAKYQGDGYHAPARRASSG